MEVPYLKYLLIKFKHGGRGWDAGDCLNLLILFYRHELGIDLQDFTGYDIHWYRKNNFMLENAAEWGFTQTDNPLPGDVALMQANGFVKHCGVMIDSDHVLHTTENGTVINHVLLIPGNMTLYGFLRHKDRNHAD